MHCAFNLFKRLAFLFGGPGGIEAARAGGKDTQREQLLVDVTFTLTLIIITTTAAAITIITILIRILFSSSAPPYSDDDGHRHHHEPRRPAQARDDKTQNSAPPHGRKQPEELTEPEALSPGLIEVALYACSWGTM